MTSEASARVGTLRFAHPTWPTEWRKVSKGHQAVPTRRQRLTAKNA